MRTATTALTVVLLLAGCATADRSATATASNAALIRSAYDAFARGDIPAVLATFDRDVVWEVAEGLPYADKSPYRGPQAVAEGLFQRLGTEWNGFGLSLQQVIDAGDTVVVLGRYSGTFKQTAKPLDAQFAHVWTFRNGKVVRLQQFADSAQFQRVMGR